MTQNNSQLADAATNLTKATLVDPPLLAIHGRTRRFRSSNLASTLEA